MQTGSPPPPGRLSPDGMWWWDGGQWQAVMPPSHPGPAAQPSTRSWFATGGALVALVGVPLILAGCIFPFVYYSDTSGGGPPSASIFNVGYTGGLFYALEPVVVMVFVAIAATFLIAWQNFVVRAVGAGVLVSFGLQTAAMFFGYLGGSTAYGRLGLGAPLGLVGGVIVLIGGCLVAANLFVKRPT